MNQISIIGNLTAEPEQAQTSAGVQIVKFNVAVSRKFKDADGNRTADFFKCVTWRQLAETCGKYLHKGSKVGVVGEMNQNKFVDRNGETRYDWSINVTAVDFLSYGQETDKVNEQTSIPTDAPRKKVSVSEMTKENDWELPF